MSFCQLWSDLPIHLFASCLSVCSLRANLGSACPVQQKTRSSCKAWHRPEPSGQCCRSSCWTWKAATEGMLQARSGMKICNGHTALMKAGTWLQSSRSAARTSPLLTPVRAYTVASTASAQKSNHYLAAWKSFPSHAEFHVMLSCTLPQQDDAAHKLEVYCTGCQSSK